MQTFIDRKKRSPQEVAKIQDQHTRGPRVRPENHDLAARPQDSGKLGKYLDDLRAIKMLDHSQIVDAIEGRVWERKGEDTAMFYFDGLRVVSRIAAERGG